MLLAEKRVAKPWGRDDLPAPFGTGDGTRIGEIWFEPAPPLESVLVKFLFTSEKLSVQNHPSNSQSTDSKGKEECWLILEALPGARVALGTRQAVSAQRLREAALDGSLEELLDWRPVSANDFFYVPAGTIHTIGEGLTLVEVQQNSDVTYRLFDYGRPRELHLDEGIAVADLAPYADKLVHSVDPAASSMLVDGPYFRLAHVTGECPAGLAAHFTETVQVVPITGMLTIEGKTIVTGQSALVGSIGDIAVPPNTRWLAAAAV